jgi:hypothetical protein
MDIIKSSDYIIEKGELDRWYSRARRGNFEEARWNLFRIYFNKIVMSL